MAFVVMKDNLTDEEKKKSIEEIGKHKRCTGVRSRLNVQARQQKLYGSLKPIRVNKKNKEEKKYRTQCVIGKVKVKGSSKQPDGWYSIAQGADCVYGKDEGKKLKAVTTQGTFKNGRSK